MTLTSCLLLAIAAQVGGASPPPTAVSPPPLVAAERPDFSPTPRSARLLSAEDLPAAAPGGPAARLDPAPGAAPGLAERRRQLDGRIALLELERPVAWPKVAVVAGAVVGAGGLVVALAGMMGIFTAGVTAFASLIGGFSIALQPGWLVAFIAGAVALAAGLVTLVSGLLAGPRVARRQAEVDRELEGLRRDRLRLEAEPGQPSSALPPPGAATSLTGSF